MITNFNLENVIKFWYNFLFLIKMENYSGKLIPLYKVNGHNIF